MEAGQYKDAGNAAMQRKDFEEAVRCYSQAIELDSKNHIFFSNRSAAFASAGRYQEALTDAKRTVELAPGFAKGHSRLGTTYMFVNDYANAVAAFEECVRLEPENQQFKNSLSQAQIKLEESRKSGGGGGLFEDPNLLTSFLQYMQNPSSVSYDPRFELLRQEFMKYQTSNDTAAAAAATTNSKTTPQKKPEKSPSTIQRELGNEAYKKKDFETALSHYEKALESGEGDSAPPAADLFAIRNNIAAVYFEMKQYKSCIKECKKVIEQGRQQQADYKVIARALARIANAKMKLGKEDKALVYYNQSLVEFRDPAIVKKVKAIEQMRKERAAREYYNPELAEQERLLGNECFTKGNYPDAIKHYNESLKRRPDDHRVYSNRAGCFQKLMEFNLALGDSEKCIKLDPSFIKGYLRKGHALLAMKEPFQAKSAFEQALALDSNCQEAHGGVAACRDSISKMSPEMAREKALKDPEIQDIMKDPAMGVILEQMRSDPSAAMSHMRNPEIYSKILKLIDAGIITTR